MSRLSGLQGQQVDVAVIGGGIIGCGIARDAALRGLSVALFEQRDFGSGTTSASTRIVHGGLRYLEMLDFRLVRLDLVERETLLRIAPHLVEPLEFTIPFFRGDGVSSLKLRIGLALYDALSGGKSLPSRRWLSAGEARRADRALQRQDVRGAATYYDARVDSPERLALENVIDARAHHAQSFNYCEVVSCTNNGTLTTLRVRDTLDGAEATFSARVVVNATGAWFDRAAERLTARRPRALRTTKGVHIVTAPLTDRAMVLYSQVDGRLLFAIPRVGLTWIGTTDTDFADDPARAGATKSDVDYLVSSVRHVFPALTPSDVLYTTAGVRALVRQHGSESSVSRMHRIVDGEPVGPPGMISVLGGKITGYRAIAEEVTDAVCRRLGAQRSCRTAEAPLPGGRDHAARADRRRDPVTGHLYDLYGARAADVIQLGASQGDLMQPLAAGYPDLQAQAVFAVRHEQALRLSDFMRRRTMLGASADQGWGAAPAAAAAMAVERGWSPSETQDEIEAYRRDIAATQEFKS